MSDPSIFLTGASGFVGQHLARSFAARGWRVVGTFLHNEVAIPGVEMVRLDLEDRGGIAELLARARPAAVVHCAAATKVGWCEGNPDAARRVIVGGTRNLLDGLGEAGSSGRLILFSTDLVFDGGAAPYAEDALGKPLSQYGSLKWAAEREVLASPRGMVLRSALVYGPPVSRADSFLGWMLAQLRSPEGATLFEDEWRTPVYVGDLAWAVEILLGTGGKAGKVFHAGGPDRLNRVEMGRLAAGIFGVAQPAIRIARRGDIAGGQRRPRDVSLATKRLRTAGWKPTPFVEGMTICRNTWPDGRIQAD